MFLKIISIIAALIAPQVENKPERTCDNIKHEAFQEGNLGQAGTMPWLGVIRAQIHVGSTTQIAVTGAILIKPKYALANADDMSKIRRKGISKAMFITHDRGMWTCKLGEVLIHPEYEFETYCTMAVAELDTESIAIAAPMLPICPPPYMYNTSDQLYALGFTDENKLLEKVAYKVQYVERSLCDEFYDRAGHPRGLYTPVLYQCAFAENNLRNCEWENGMALASNISGYWVLVGISVQGPGCSAPARFLDLYPYLHWINTSTSNEEINPDYPFQVKVRRFGDIDSLEGINTNKWINRTNYFKTRSEPFNITFREFLKEYNNQKNETLNTIKNDKTFANSTEYFIRETKDNVTSNKSKNQDGLLPNSKTRHELEKNRDEVTTGL